MSGTAAPVAVPSSGSTQIDAVSMSNGTVTVERQVLTVADPVNWASQAQVGNSTPGSTDFGMTVRTAGSVITEGKAATGAAVVGNPVYVGGIDGGGLARPFLADSAGRQISSLAILQESQFPGFDIIDPTAVSNPNVDKFGSLVTRGAVLTDEGTWRANFSNSSLLVSIGSCTVSGSTVTGTFDATQDVRLGDYFKFDADAETAYVQISSVSPTKITLASSYSGAASGAASRSKLSTSTLTGATVSVASGQYVLVSGTGGTVGQNRLFRNVDYLPLSLRASYQLSGRFTNQIGWLGFRENASTFSNHRFFAAFIFSGVTAGSVTCITGFNATGAPTSSEKDQITINMPYGLSELSANDYRIDVLSDVVNFYIANVLVASTSLHIPAPYSSLSSGFWLDVQGATTSCTHKLDYISVKNHDVIEVNTFSPETRVISRLPVSSTINAGTVTSTAFSYTYNIPDGATMLTAVVNGGFSGTLNTLISRDSFSNWLPATVAWMDGNNNQSTASMTFNANLGMDSGARQFATSTGYGGVITGEILVPPGMTQMRITCTTYTSGSPVIYITPSISGPKWQPFLQVEGLNITGATVGTKSKPIQVGGSDGTALRSLLTDTSGRMLVAGAGVAGSAIVGNPVLMAGSDATNTRAFLTTTSGVLNVQVAGSTGTALLPAAAATADAFANPTTTNITSLGDLFNGTTWDRARNNVNVTMGDTGAKTVTFTGATQTNYNAAGAKIMVLCGTVTGTTPTLSAQVQISPDGGTTWLNYGAASGTVTTTGTTILIDVYPTNESGAGATPSALTTGATQTLQINGALPRTWRLSYTIGGTTPSFTLTNAYAAYTL